MQWASLCVVVVLCLVIPLATPAQTEWVEVRSANFVVVSNGGEKRAREIGAQFERIRSVFQNAVTGNGASKAKEPSQALVVIAAADRKTFESLMLPEWSRESTRRPPGFFVKSPDRHYVVVRADLRGEQAHQLIYHEYFHLYEALNLPQLPLWLSEGLAEFHAGTIIRGERVIRGSGMLRHKLLLREAKLIPLRELFAVRKDSALYTDSEKSGLFYAQAWALVHMIMLDERGGGARITELIRRLHEGATADRAHLEVFGNVAELQKRLASYVRRVSHPTLHLDGALSTKLPEFTTRVLRTAEVAILLGEFFLTTNRSEDALRLAEEAIRTPPEMYGAYDLLGQILLRRGDHAGARKALGMAIEQGSTDWRTYYTAGCLLAQAAQEGREIREVQKLLGLAEAMNPDSPLVVSAVAGILLDSGGDPIYTLDLALRATTLEPANANHHMQLARALLRNNLRSEARVSAQRALELAVTDSSRLEMQAFLKNMGAPALASPSRVGSAPVREVVIWIKDEAAEEALRRWKAERAAVAHIQTFVSGRVLATNCTGPPRLNVELETDAGTLKLSAANSGIVAYYVTEGAPPKKFEPCRDLRGKTVGVVYRPLKKGSSAGEILAVDMHP